MPIEHEPSTTCFHSQRFDAAAQPGRRAGAILHFACLMLLAAAAGVFACGLARAAGAPVPQTPTPMILAVHDNPVPFNGSDGHAHIVYELWLTNFSSSKAEVKKATIRSGSGEPLQTLDTAAVASRLQPAGSRSSSATMLPGTQSLLFIHIILPLGHRIPAQLRQEVDAYFPGVPPAYANLSATLRGTEVSRRQVAVVGPPLSGGNYVSADSCCDSTRHMRAVLGVNGRVWIAQRYAVDWEQLDANKRIYSGAKESLRSYTIWGKPVLAVADGIVVTAINDQPDQPPGSFPPGLTLDQADGNAVIMNLGDGNYAMYAHMQKGSVRVSVGQRVKRGQVLGLVGNSGNTIAPHLHFQLMSGRESLASNGLPYGIDNYQITGSSPGTDAFDHAEANGTPLAVTPAAQPTKVHAALPLDQLIISFEP